MTVDHEARFRPSLRAKERIIIATLIIFTLTLWSTWDVHYNGQQDTRWIISVVVAVVCYCALYSATVGYKRADARLQREINNILDDPRPQY